MAHNAVFLDRDDTLIEDPGYINHPNQVKLLPGAADAVIQLKNLKYKVIIITNQSAVARGIVTEKILGQIHQRLKELLGQRNAFIDKIYYCPYHPDGVVPKYRKESDLRKPNAGMILQAADEMDIDLENSWMIGNSYRDISAGLRAGCKTILIDSPIKPAQKKLADPTPDKKAVNLKEAVNIIKMHNQQTRTPQPIPETTEAEIERTLVPESVQAEDQPPATEQETQAAPVAPTPEPEEAPSQEPQEPQPITPEPLYEMQSEPESIEQMLKELHTYLRKANRNEMFEEFSSMRFAATILQTLVVFCLVLSLWFILDDTKTLNAVNTTIGYAITLQLMVIAFCLLRKKK